MKNDFMLLKFLMLIILVGCSGIMTDEQCLESIERSSNDLLDYWNSLEKSVDLLIGKNIRLETENFLLKNCEQTSAFDRRYPGFVWYHCDDDTDMSYWPIRE